MSKDKNFQREDAARGGGRGRTAQAPRCILVVDDEETIRYTLRTLFSRAGYDVETTASAEEALKHFEVAPERFPVVVTDYQLERMDGLAFLARLKAIHPAVAVIMITAHGSERVAVEAMKRGAVDYFSKPFKNDELLLKVDLAFAPFERGRARQAEGPEVTRFGAMLSRTPAMHLLFDKIRRVARSEVTVLVTGESGTGKELVARSIHEHGPRRHGPFVPLNCAAIPAELLENELFGHEKGAYTGAVERAKGRFEAASGGTLFLDEIGDMPMPIQAKVLRALQDKTIERVGGGAPVKVDVRILAATHKDLSALIAEGRFREDLFYRINVINLHLPPLRERPEDIPLLVDAFLADAARRTGSRVERFDPGALDFLKAYPWPGNVRQLQNTIERILVLTDLTVIDEAEAKRHAELPEARTPPAPTGPSGAAAGIDPALFGLEYKKATEELKRRFDRGYIEEALRKNGCNISQTAKRIGVNRSFLHDRINELGIDVERLRYESRAEREEAPR